MSTKRVPGTRLALLHVNVGSLGMVAFLSETGSSGSPVDGTELSLALVDDDRRVASFQWDYITDR
jgi:hypothetical protein